MRKLALAIFLCIGFSLFAQNGLRSLNEGISNVGKGNYDKATEVFREIILDVDKESFHPDAYFWLSKTLIVTGDLEEAEKNLEYFLSFYKENRHYPEGYYQKGRLLYLQGEYENSITVLTSFIKAYSSSPYIPNAHFWIGECLYELGMWDESAKAFQHVVTKYPTSYKYEASQYRIKLIGLKKREEELIKLVQWSHEENLKTLEEFRRREKGFQIALAEYQQKLSLLQSKELEAELIQLQEALAASQNQVKALNNKIAQLTGQMDDMETELTSRGGTIDQIALSQDEAVKRMIDLLNVKDKALDLKEFYFTLLLEEGINLNE